ncbi:MAG: hypothetical protein F6K31_08095 [Symploca sp. SIO2G7]|nr:hypothetical protein [Symploca sp. SIO2G7]
MTAIAIWFNNENPKNPSLWVASDSRVSKPVPENQYSTLIDDAAKVFTLPVVCSFPGKEGFFSQVGYYHTYGYCFAGNTLLGQNTFLALMPLLSNLAATQLYVPEMTYVADFILRYLGRAFDDYKAIATEGSLVEVALFGWCRATQKQHVFHYYPDKDEDGYLVIKCMDYTYPNEENFVYLGAHSKDIKQKIKEAFDRESEPGKPISRSPRYIIEECIQNSEYTTIGGNLQLGIADQLGFRPLSICKPRVPGKPEAYLSYLGYELHQDIRNVGHAFVNLPGMV